MKRLIPLMVGLALLLCFAMPAIASPPVALPTLEALGLVVGTYQATQALAEIASAAIDTGPVLSSANYTETASSALALVVLFLTIATAATLADFKRSTTSFFDRFKVAGFASGNGRSRRWV